MSATLSNSRLWVLLLALAWSMLLPLGAHVVASEARPNTFRETDQGKEKQLALKKLPWQRPMLLDQSPVTGEVDVGKEAKVWIDKALAARGDAALVPALRGLIYDDILFYRTFSDVRAVYLKDDKAAMIKAGDFHWKGVPQNGSLADFLSQSSHRFVLERWLEQLPKAALAQVVLENQCTGSISGDGTRVYVVDELAVPAPPNFDDKAVQLLPDIARQMYRENTLRAFNVKSGKLDWDIGTFVPKHPLPQSHFLGAPLAFNNKLYILNETNKADLRLIVVDPDNGKIEETHPLDIVPAAQRYLVNQQRRLHAAHLLAHGKNLICIAQNGKVFSVQTGKHAIGWTYAYQNNPPPAGGKFALGDWKTPAPFIHDGKLVFTAGDDDHIHCVDLTNGKGLWKVKRADDVYLAGIVGNKVMVVGNTACRALGLNDGKEVWKIATGTPSGVGVFKKTTYLLPLKKGASSKQPEIAHIGADGGILIGVSPLTEMPGNLLLHDGMVLSQSTTAVTGYQLGN